MTVYFVGAGPGAADLLTLRAHDLLRRCPVCLYAGSLVPDEIIALTPPEARRIDTASLRLEDIVAEIEAAHAQGADVARLCSGDPSIYSAVHEQAAALAARAIPYEIVPGVPAFAAAAAVLQRELTVPGLVQTVVLTRTATNSSPVPPSEALERLAETRATLVFHVSARALPGIAAGLVPCYGRDCPAAVVAFASRPEQRIVRGTLDDIVRRAAEANITRTAVILVGRALDPGPEGRSALYGTERARTAPQGAG